MTFYFSVYSTPLLFGFIQGWVYAILLWVRGYREERLSDTLLGWVLVGLCFDIWMYMLGFGGIEIFWRELEFFPRSLGYLLPPLVYFYLKSQFDTTFRFRLRDGWHALPFIINTTYHLVVFAQGPAFVRQWEMQVHDRFLGIPLFVLGTVQQFLYLYWSLQLYWAYRAWTKTQFSDTDSISFHWFRNFLIAVTITVIFSLIINLIDSWLDLTFWQDWWGNLVGVVLIYYVSIEGYGQKQAPRKLTFRPNASEVSLGLQSILPLETDTLSEPQTTTLPELISISPANSVGTLPEKQLAVELEPLKDKLLAYMTTEKPFLDSDLSLADLARRLHTNPVLLSQVINTGAGKNFNDFINEYRVEEFKRQLREPTNAHLSFLGLALDCGFNSKATFNRAFKKFTGASPKEFAET